MKLWVRVCVGPRLRSGTNTRPWRLTRDKTAEHPLRHPPPHCILDPPLHKSASDRVPETPWAIFGEIAVTTNKADHPALTSFVPSL